MSASDDMTEGPRHMHFYSLPRDVFHPSLPSYHHFLGGGYGLSLEAGKDFQSSSWARWGSTLVKQPKAGSWCVLCHYAIDMFLHVLYKTY